MALATFLPTFAEPAAAQTPPATRYSALVQGDFTVTGNTLNECCFDPTDGDSLGSANPPTSSADTNTSSRASFAIPSGAAVVKAYLYVLVDSSATAAVPTTMKIAGAGRDYADAAMIDVGEDGGGRVVRGDVTAEVAAGGAGEVWVGAPNSFPAPGNLHSWGLFVVYSAPTLPWRQVVLVDQASMIGGGGPSTMSATVSDLAVAPGGSADATLAMFEFYSSGGDADTLQICTGTSTCPDTPGSYANPSVYARNAANPYNNVANASFTIDGAPMPGTSPSPTLLWSDLDLFTMPGAIPTSATSATVTARSLGDTVFSGFMGLSTTVYAPISQLSSAVTGTPAVGGFIDYELTYDLDNTGDDAGNVVIADTLPGNITYVPGSASVTAGANAGAKTDAAGDDQFDITGSALTWRVGTGATSSTGGAVPTSAGPQTLRFRAQVTSGTIGDAITDDATATLNGVRAASLTFSATASSTTNIIAIPAAPTPGALTSSADGPATQSATATVPVGGSITLLDGSTAVSTLAVTGQGTYSLNTSTGVISFAPVTGYTGSPTPVNYRVTDSFAQTGSNTYSPAVTTPAAPSPAALTSTGVGTAAQTATAVIPAGGSVRLLDGSTPVTTLTVPGQGTYSLNTSTGVVTFTAVLGYAGSPTPVTYRVTDSFAQTGSNTYAPTVTTPSAPAATARTSTGVGVASQTATVTVPANTTVTLLDGSTPVTTLTITGEGTYVLNPGTGVITFTPVLGYTGIATAVTYRLNDTYGQSNSSTYTPTVNAPGAPPATVLTSTGAGTSPQGATIVVPTGGTVTLLDGSTPVTTLAIPGEGTYVLNPGTGVVTFTPVLGYTGTVTPVNYRVTDAYGQNASSTYAPTVTLPPAPPATTLATTGIGPAVQTDTITVPVGGSITLLDGIVPVTSLTVPGQGTYVLNPATGDISFTPVLGFSGAVAAINFQVTDAYGQTATSTYTPAITMPTAPLAPTRTTEAAAGVAQTMTITVPVGGSVALMDGTAAVNTITMAGQGTYTLDPVSGLLTFTPVAGFTGKPTAVTYRVTDAYGQATTGRFAPEVLGITQQQTTTTTTTTPAATSIPAQSPAPGSLAFTGSDLVGRGGLISLALLALGALAVGTRRVRLAQR